MAEGQAYPTEAQVRERLHQEREKMESDALGLTPEELKGVPMSAVRAVLAKTTNLKEEILDSSDSSDYYDVVSFTVSNFETVAQNAKEVATDGTRRIFPTHSIKFQF